MLLHPSLQSLLKLSNPTIDTHTTWDLPHACPACQHDILVAPQALVCHSTECNWEAHMDLSSQKVTQMNWVLEVEGDFLMVLVDYQTNCTELKGVLETTLPIALTPEELRELWLWL